MNLIVPIHQIEIRYSSILNFQFIIQEALSPFVQLASNVQIERENTVHARYTLIFDDYNIFVTWDRIIFRYEGNLEMLGTNNSIIEEPFFNIFNKIKELKEFGTITNFVFYTMYINLFENKNKEDVVKAFMTKYYNQIEINKILSNPTDLAIITDKKAEGEEISLTFGPYLGIEDITKRNLVTQNKNLLENNKFGEMAEIKIFGQVKTINFSKYKEILKTSQELTKKIWPSNN